MQQMNPYVIAIASNADKKQGNSSDFSINIIASYTVKIKGLNRPAWLK